MKKVYIEKLKSELEIGGEKARHLIYSLRARRGEQLQAVDVGGNRAIIELTGFDRNNVFAKVVGEIMPPPAIKPIVLAVCLPKQNRMDDIVRQATELGVTHIQPLISDRTIARPSPIRVKTKMERWHRIIHEASEQSGSELPTIGKIEELTDWLEEPDYNLLIFCNERERSFGISEPLHGYKGGVTILVGCEGGFTEREARIIEEAGGESVSLGQRILRVETAAICALSIVQYEISEEM